MSNSTTFNFCTLFDSYYLSRGIALYKSLELYCENFHLYIFAFDHRSYEILSKLNFHHATIISLKEFENDDLLKVKPLRTIAEYCWTATASSIWYSIQNYDLDHCTYLDADILFFSSPIPIFQEIGSSSIGITPHNFSSNLKSSEIYGKYCVQFTYFRNDIDGMKALEWWKNSTIEWCYAKMEDGKYGDQKYLNYFEEMFDNVCIIKHNGAGVAPWNVSRYNFECSSNSISIKTKNKPIKKFDLIFYHYQGLKFKLNDSVVVSNASPLNIPKDVLVSIYEPYVSRLIEIKNELSSTVDSFDNIIFKRKLIVVMSQYLKNYIRNFTFLTSMYFKYKKNRYNKPIGIGAKLN